MDEQTTRQVAGTGTRKLQYRAIAHVDRLGAERPLQTFSASRSVIGDWVTRTMAQVPAGTVVEVFEVEERLETTFVKRAGSGTAAGAEGTKS